MPEAYVEVEVRADPILGEELAGLLSQLGFEGFWEDGPFLRCYIRSSRWDSRMLDEVRSTAKLLLRPSHEKLPEIAVRSVPIEDWNARWESTLQPIRVSKRIIITPSWHPATPSPGDIVLVIDPKMSFGTGYHESTRLVLRLMEEFVHPGISVLDLGTGTGVLAIAAVRLGAAHALGFDIDEWSYDNALENVRRNNVEHLVTIRRGSIADAPVTTFDVVTANIQRSVIEPALSEILGRLAPHGVLLLGGLLTEDSAPMVHSLKSLGMTPRREISENEWIAIAATRA